MGSSGTVPSEPPAAPPPRRRWERREGEPAVIVDDVSKKFRLYKERNNSVKAALMRTSAG